ncbi:MAG: response regulator [Gammaproteobacteria bacterium]
MAWKSTKKRPIHLIISDVSTCKQLSQLLNKIPVEVKIFESAEVFLAAPISESPACLITEVNLGDSDAITFIKELRKHGLSTPVVVLADGNNSVNTAVKAIQAGASDFIEKPIVERDFIERVKKVLTINN